MFSSRGFTISYLELVFNPFELIYVYAIRVACFLLFHKTMTFKNVLKLNYFQRGIFCSIYMLIHVYANEADQEFHANVDIKRNQPNL